MKIKPLLCEQYWNHIQKTTKNLTKKELTQVSAFDISDVNNYLIGSKYTNKERITRLLKPDTVEEIIAKTDIAIKNSEPLKQDTVFYRGVQVDKRDTTPLNRLNQIKELNSGDTFSTPVYDFVTKVFSLAEYYSKENKKGVLFEINVPKGTKLLRAGGGFVLPRGAKFECISNENHTNYKYITVNYLKNKTTFCDKVKEKFSNMFKK